MLELDRIDRVHRRAAVRDLVAARSVHLEVAEAGRDDPVVTFVRRSRRRPTAGGGDPLPLDLDPAGLDCASPREQAGDQPAQPVPPPRTGSSAGGSAISGGRRISAIAWRRSRRITGRFRSSCANMRGQFP